MIVPQFITSKPSSGRGCNKIVIFVLPLLLLKIRKSQPIRILRTTRAYAEAVIVFVSSRRLFDLNEAGYEQRGHMARSFPRSGLRNSHNKVNLSVKEISYHRSKTTA